jgi:hypothetical protein
VLFSTAFGGGGENLLARLHRTKQLNQKVSDSDIWLLADLTDENLDQTSSSGITPVTPAVSDPQMLSYNAASVPAWDVFPDYDWAATLELPPDLEQLIINMAPGENLYPGNILAPNMNEPFLESDVRA